jgi:phenylalanyl-tRNA synthetase alpha chain
MPPTLLEPAALQRALSLRDLTDPAHGPHAMQVLLTEIETALADAWPVPIHRHRAHPVVSIADNYDRLGYPAEAVTRDARYTRYVTAGTVLRGQTSAMIPPLLEGLAAEAASGPVDLVLSCPGLVYRRDVIDRKHVGEPHQVDIWRIRAGSGGSAQPAGTPGRLGAEDLEAMIAIVLEAALPGRPWRTIPASHPYTVDGRQIDAYAGGEWVEVGECGLADPALLDRCGLAPSVVSGLAMGLGLDRLLMLRKGIDDIRLLRATDSRIAEQMLDLDPYRPVSAMPPVRRDLSIAVAADATSEDLGDQVRAALGQRALAVESVEVLSETPAAELPQAARERLGIRPEQKNVLLRVVLRDLERTLTDSDANQLRDRIYAALHAGSVHTWAEVPGASPAG